MPIVTENDGEDYILLEGETLKRVEETAQTTNEINKIIEAIESDTSIKKSDRWKVIIERLSGYTAKLVNNLGEEIQQH